MRRRAAEWEAWRRRTAVLEARRVRKAEAKAARRREAEVAAAAAVCAAAQLAAAERAIAERAAAERAAVEHARVVAAIAALERRDSAERSAALAALAAVFGGCLSLRGTGCDNELRCSSSEADAGCATAPSPCRRAGGRGPLHGRGRRRPHRRWRARRESFYIRCSPPLLLQQLRRGMLDVCSATPLPREGSRRTCRTPGTSYGIMVHVVRCLCGFGRCSLGAAYRAFPAGLPRFWLIKTLEL